VFMLNCLAISALLEILTKDIWGLNPNKFSKHLA
jgi:hypothetical protein